MSLQVLKACGCHYHWHLGNGEQLAELVVEVRLVSKNDVNVLCKQKLSVFGIAWLLFRLEICLLLRDRLLFGTEAPQYRSIFERSIRLRTVENVHFEVHSCPSDGGRNSLD